MYEALSSTGVYVLGRGVDSALRLNARRALTLMDRFPVSDDVTYSIEEEEGLIDDDTVALSHLCVLILLYIVSSYCCILCPHTAVYCVLILLYVVSSYCFTLCPHTAICCVLMLCQHQRENLVGGCVFFTGVLILL